MTFAHTSPAGAFKPGDNLLPEASIRLSGPWQLQASAPVHDKAPLISNWAVAGFVARGILWTSQIRISIAMSGS